VNCFKTCAPPPDAEIWSKSAMPPLPHVPSWHARGLLSLLLCYRTVLQRLQLKVTSDMYVHSSRPALGPTYPPIQWAPSAFSLWVKWPGYEAVHSTPHPLDAEVKHETFMLLSCVRCIDKTYPLKSCSIP